MSVPFILSEDSSDYSLVDLIGATQHYKGSGWFWLTFSDGDNRLVDITAIIKDGPAFQELLINNNEKLGEFKIANGTMTWDNEQLDIAPETLRIAPDVRATQYVWVR